MTSGGRHLVRHAGAALSHQGGNCIFETILKRHGLDDPVLWDIARIVHPRWTCRRARPMS
jgi:hypothetical protein